MMRRYMIVGAIVLLAALPSLGFTAQKEFVESYTYTAGEADSKLACRTISLIEVKRLLLEKIGTYLTSRTEVKDFKVEKDEVMMLTAGVVKLQILDEKWTGEKYTLTARIEANPDDVAKAIQDLKKQSDRMENIQKLKDINDSSLDEIRQMQFRMQQLQTDLFKLNQDAGANQNILNAWGLYEKAVSLRQSGKLEQAMDALNIVIKNNPSHTAYYERGLANLEMGKFEAAIADLTETLKVEPNMRGALWFRGVAQMKSGQKKKGRQDIEKAAALGGGRAKKWLAEHPALNKKQ